MDFNETIKQLKSKLDETSGALVSEELIALAGMNQAINDQLQTANETIESLKKNNDELLKVNGKLFQKIGFESPKEKEKMPFQKEEEAKIKIEDIIDTKGNFL